MPQRQLKSIRVSETSGVDRPAHLQNGWLIMKSIDQSKAQGMLASLGRGESNMPTAKPSLLEFMKSLTPDEVAAFQKDVSANDLTTLADSIAAIWKTTQGLAEEADPNTPSPSDGATVPDPNAAVPAADPNAVPAAPDAASVLAQPAIMKALGTDGVALLKAQFAKAAANEKLIVDMVNEKREQEAIAKAKDFTEVLGGEDKVTEFAKAFSSFEVVNPAGAALVTAALKKAAETNTAADAIITKEIGITTGVVPGSPAAQIEQIAKSYQSASAAAGGSISYEVAYQKALADNPALFDAAWAAKGK